MPAAMRKLYADCHAHAAAPVLWVQANWKVDGGCTENIYVVISFCWEFGST